MAVKLPKPQYTEESSRVRQALAKLEQLPLLGGNLLSDVSLSTTPKNVAHGLGKTWTGYIITSRDANAVVYESDSPDESKFIKLTASAAVVVSIYIF